MNQVHLDTARLLTQVAPLVLADKVFALKGGTAINLFVRDMPRLSVDRDEGILAQPRALARSCRLFIRPLCHAAAACSRTPNACTNFSIVS